RSVSTSRVSSATLAGSLDWLPLIQIKVTKLAGFVHFLVKNLRFHRGFNAVNKYQFSSELAVRFLEEYRLTGDEIDMSGQGWRKHVVWSVRALADFAENGRIERAFTDLEAIHLVPAMQNTLCDYAQYCKDRLQLRPGTLHERT